MATKRCPNCNLVNPGSAQTCDCGFSFGTGELGRPLDLSKPGDPRPMGSSGSNVATRVLIWIIVVAVAVTIKLAIRR